jgi:hypothetical protein
MTHHFSSYGPNEATVCTRLIRSINENIRELKWLFYSDAVLATDAAVLKRISHSQVCTVSTQDSYD